MKHRLAHLIILLNALLLLSLAGSACQPLPEPTPASTATPSISPTPTIALGELQREESGGFTYQPIPGYQIAASSGVVSMLEAQANPNIGPSLTLYGGAPSPGASAQSLLEQLKASKDTMLDEPEAVIIGGFEGLAADLILTRNASLLYGRIVIVVTPEVQFIALGAGPQERWHDDLELLFDAVLASVTFFPRATATPEPSTAPAQVPTPQP